MVLQVFGAVTVKRLWPTPGSAGAVPRSAFCAPSATVRRMAGVHLSEGLRQLVQRASQDAHVVRMPQVGGQGDLGRLVIQIAPQMGAAHTAPQALLGGAEKLLDDVVCALHNL